jgi:propionate catabolism operon transcriptional regulator
VPVHPHQHPDPNLTADIQEQAEVFVAGSSNLRATKQMLNVPCVGIEVDYQDYLHHILTVAREGRHHQVGIVTYQEPLPYDFQEIEALVGVKVCNIVYDSSDDLRESIARSGCTVILGGGYACETAEQLGLTGILIYPGVAVIVKAFREAKTLAQHLRREKKEMLYYASVIGETPNGIISIDHNGIITNYNPSAGKYLGVSAAVACGQPASRLFPELDLESTFRQKTRVEDVVVLYRERQLHLRKILMKEDKGLEAAATALITDLSDFRKSEMSYLIKQRASLAKSGFVSKYRFSDIVGKCRPLTETISYAKIYAKTNYNVLIYGETGTGKELLAQSICNASDRSEQNFVAVNCAALPDNLLESELFGYKEGAFTGSAKGGRRGLFELANGGTIFLDEIGSVSPNLQVKLLRVLQEREIMRIGDDKIIPVDVRVISATNQYYEAMLEGGFRRDLLFRLNELELTLPPLRVRGKDVILLFRSFLRQTEGGEELEARIQNRDLSILESYSWPGNIRELHNVCARFSILFRADGNAGVARTLRECIGSQRLVTDILHRYRYQRGSKQVDPVMLRELSEELGYKKEQLAELLGVSRTTLWRLEKDKGGHAAEEELPAGKTAEQEGGV